MNKSKRRNKIKLIGKLHSSFLNGKEKTQKKIDENTRKGLINNFFLLMSFVRVANVDKNTGQVKYFYKIKPEIHFSIFSTSSAIKSGFLFKKRNEATEERIKKIKTIGNKALLVIHGKDIKFF